MKLFEPIRNFNTKALCRILNDGIVLEDGKLLFFKDEKTFYREYSLQEQDVFSSDSRNILFCGEEVDVVSPLFGKKARIIPFSKHSLLFQYTKHDLEPIFYFWVDDSSIGSCTLSAIRSFYQEPISQFVYSDLKQLRNHFEGEDHSTLVIGSVSYEKILSQEVIPSLLYLDKEPVYTVTILYFKDKNNVWVDHREFIDFDWLFLKNFGNFGQKSTIDYLFSSIYKMNLSSYKEYGEDIPYLVLRFFEREIQLEEILLLQREGSSKYILYSKGCTFSKEEILLHQKEKCLKK